jgi:hypothetical protein
MFMHNGGVAQFDRVSHSIFFFLVPLPLRLPNRFPLKIKRRLIATLKEDIFLFVQGSTDSEWSFALFLNFVSAFSQPIN